MLIALLDFTVEENNHASALSILSTAAATVVQMTGNIAFRPLADPDGISITLLHEWENRESFEAYLASGSFATLGLKLRPMMTRPPVSRRFDAELIESV